MRMLFLADTHLGFDDPLRARVERRRRGPEFFESFRRALAPARRGEVGLVLHGGDIFFRSKVRPGVVQRALDIIAEVTEAGVPFVLVPGNHERSATPLPLLWDLPGLLVFRKPDTFVIEAGGVRLALAGFPCERTGIRTAFPGLLAATGWMAHDADIRLLCLHQAVEGATVGLHNYTFRRGRDVVPGAMVPAGFAAVLCGHIHRRQTLIADLRGRPLAAPVLYPGSTERTAFAEKDETKGYLLLDLVGTPNGSGDLENQRFVPLPSRPMVDLALAAEGLDREQLEALIKRELGRLDPESILRLTVDGWPSGEGARPLGAAALRALAPRMNIELRISGNDCRGSSSAGPGTRRSAISRDRADRR